MDKIAIITISIITVASNELLCYPINKKGPDSGKKNYAKGSGPMLGF